MEYKFTQSTGVGTHKQKKEKRGSFLRIFKSKKHKSKSSSEQSTSFDSDMSERSSYTVHTGDTYSLTSQKQKYGSLGLKPDSRVTVDLYRSGNIINQSPQSNHSIYKRDEEKLRIIRGHPRTHVSGADGLVRVLSGGSLAAGHTVGTRNLGGKHIQPELIPSPSELDTVSNVTDVSSNSRSLHLISNVNSQHVLKQIQPVLPQVVSTADNVNAVRNYSNTQRQELSSANIPFNGGDTHKVILQGESFQVPDSTEFRSLRENRKAGLTTSHTLNNMPHAERSETNMPIVKRQQKTSENDTDIIRHNGLLIRDTYGLNQKEYEQDEENKAHLPQNKLQALHEDVYQNQTKSDNFTVISQAAKKIPHTVQVLRGSERDFDQQVVHTLREQEWNSGQPFAAIPPSEYYVKSPPSSIFGGYESEVSTSIIEDRPPIRKTFNVQANIPVSTILPSQHSQNYITRNNYYNQGVTNQSNGERKAFVDVTSNVHNSQTTAQGRYSTESKQQYKPTRHHTQMLNPEHQNVYRSVIQIGGEPTQFSNHEHPMYTSDGDFRNREDNASHRVSVNKHSVVKSGEYGKDEVDFTNKSENVVTRRDDHYVRRMDQNHSRLISDRSSENSTLLQTNSPSPVNFYHYDTGYQQQKEAYSTAREPYRQSYGFERQKKAASTTAREPYRQSYGFERQKKEASSTAREPYRQSSGFERQKKEAPTTARELYRQRQMELELRRRLINESVKTTVHIGHEEEDLTIPTDSERMEFIDQDIVDEKITLGIQNGKAQIKVTERTERMVPLLSSGDTFKKSVSLVTKTMEVDMNAMPETRALFDKINTSPGITRRMQYKYMSNEHTLDSRDVYRIYHVLLKLQEEAEPQNKPIKHNSVVTETVNNEEFSDSTSEMPSWNRLSTSEDDDSESILY